MSAPKKKSRPGNPGKTSDDRAEGNEAGPLAKENKSFKAKL